MHNYAYPWAHVTIGLWRFRNTCCIKDWLLECGTYTYRYYYYHNYSNLYKQFRRQTIQKMHIFHYWMTPMAANVTLNRSQLKQKRTVLTGFTLKVSFSQMPSTCPHVVFRCLILIDLRAMRTYASRSVE